MFTVNLEGKIPDVGSIAFLRAEWWSPESKFRVIFYSIDGKEQELGLVIDIDKRVFLDHVNEEVSKQANTILAML